MEIFFSELEASWAAFQTPVQAPEPTGPPTPRARWEAELEALWESFCVTPTAPAPTALPPPSTPGGWLPKLEALWQEVTRPIAVLEPSAPPPPPAGPTWQVTLEKQWEAFGQPIVVEPPTPPPVPRPLPLFSDAEASWAAFQRALLDLPLPPTSWRVLKRQRSAAEASRPRPAWEKGLIYSWEALVKLFDQPDPAPVELPKPRKRSAVPDCEKELFGAWRLAIAPIVPEGSIRLHQPESTFADLPTWEQQAWRIWWQFEEDCRQIDRLARLVPVAGRVVPEWEFDLEQAWQTFAGRPEIKVERWEAEREASGLPTRPLTFEELLKAVLEEGRAGDARRRSGKKRAGAEVWPTHRWKTNQAPERSGSGWLHVVRRVPVIRETETVERTTHWTGRTIRRWIVLKELVGFEPRPERIRSTTREAWEDRNEYKTTNLRLAQPGRLRRPKWLSEANWRLRLESPQGAEFAAIVEEQLSAPSPAVRKFDRVWAAPARLALPVYALDPLAVAEPVKPEVKSSAKPTTTSAKIGELLPPQVASRLVDLAATLAKEETPSSDADPLG